MTASPEFVTFVQELFAPLGGVSIRRMFGGAGIYSRGVMFGLIDEDTIYLKADAESRKAFEARGCGQFVYDGKGKPVAMSYWQMPPELVDDADEALVWAKTALAVAKAAKAAVPPSSRRITLGAARRRR
ncbi:TfoX/Sxy family protein [uncultured Ferrovibrio sp.]|jgi:DNA transformation protein|uniref:TfoX/Sxy family protein n=1 Tax=uncultured Ferrovibrio sp. TaxID=1576913 RepID=UPI002623359E|nr:TfoX/Sxy family protein [uncultured Ferrovibrio sp.]